MKKRVVWVHRFGPVLASYRYRAEMPAHEVGKINGFETAVNNGEADIVVFAKVTEADVVTARKAKAEGAKIVVDLSDDYFGTKMRGMYEEMASLSDAIVTASPVMRARLQDYIKRDATVITDPYEQEECEPHAEGENFIWFGHSRNLPEILSVQSHLYKRKLLVATGPKPTNGFPAIWGPEALKEVFKTANIALLPTVQGAENKSPNRLLNAIRAGLFPVCMAHPAYHEFRHLVWVGHFATGLRWTDAFKGELNGMVKKAQDYIRDRYSPQAIGRQWASLLESV